MQIIKIRSFLLFFKGLLYQGIRILGPILHHDILHQAAPLAELEQEHGPVADPIIKTFYFLLSQGVDLAEAHQHFHDVLELALLSISQHVTDDGA